MSDFVCKLVYLTIWLFDKTDNIVVFVPTFVLLWCAVWAVFRRLIYLWK